MTDAESGYVKLVPYTAYDPVTLAHALQLAVEADRAYPAAAPHKYMRAGATNLVGKEQAEHESNQAWHYALVAHLPGEVSQEEPAVIGAVTIRPDATLHERKVSRLSNRLCQLLHLEQLVDFPQLTHYVEAWVTQDDIAYSEQRLSVALRLAAQQVREMTGPDSDAHAWTLLSEKRDLSALLQRRAAAAAMFGKFAAGAYFSPDASESSQSAGLYVADIARLHATLARIQAGPELY